MNYFFIKYFVRTKIKLFQSRCQCQFWCWWRWRCHNFRMAPRMYHNCDGNFSLSVRIIRLLSILLILFSWFELINKWFAVNYFRNFTYAKLREKKSWLAQCINISWVKGLSTMKQKVYSEPCEISKMERFKKKRHLVCLTGFWIQLWWSHFVIYKLMS